MANEFCKITEGKKILKNQKHVPKALFLSRPLWRLSCPAARPCPSSLFREQRVQRQGSPAHRPILPCSQRPGAAPHHGQAAPAPPSKHGSPSRAEPQGSPCSALPLCPPCSPAVSSCSAASHTYPVCGLDHNHNPTFNSKAYTGLCTSPCTGKRAV